MKRLKVGLNGFGRIGRAFTRIASLRNSFDIVGINTRKTSPDMMAYLLTYDSVYRKFEKQVSSTNDSISIDGKVIKTFQSPEPELIPWDTLGVDVVIEATGAFTKSEDLKKHLRGSIRKVILTAPSKDDTTPHVVLGVNDNTFDFKSCDVLSNCSCTTNCASPVFKVLDDKFKIVTGFLTTAHAYTSTQELLDDPAKTKDRSRAAALNIVPSTTGAAKAVIKTLPHLVGKVDGMSLRVPVPTGSFTDIGVVVEKATTVEEVNAAFKEASEATMKGVLGYETEQLVSSDFIGSPYSAIVASHLTKVMNGTFVKIFAWYDNEWGYSTRLVDLVERVAESFPE